MHLSVRKQDLWNFFKQQVSEWDLRRLLIIILFDYLLDTLAVKLVGLKALR